MKDFLKYLVVWISENLSIPFWIVGHIHLTMNIYEDATERVVDHLAKVIAPGLPLPEFPKA